MIAQALGGVGLFLVGMLLVTDGLRAAAGDSVRRFLLRFSGGPLKAVLSGALVTAVVQSSSATTVATIGFVGAGLLSFEQSLGLVFGANVGTTATGWIVALLGLEFKVSGVALPLVGVGALIRLLGRGRAAHLGLALSGFGIIFVGIDVLQGGMQQVSRWFTPDQLPPDSWGGRLLLLGMGVLLTTAMQSSSAAVATTLAALHSGTISLQQAAALVIGSNIGTTVTAGIAALGTSTAAKRTAFAHLLFNGLTGAIAFAVLPAFAWVSSRVGSRVAAGDATIILATFHTAFNLFGVMVILPFSRPFARMVERAIPHRGPHLTRLLDRQVAGQGTVAAEAVRQTAIEIARYVFEALTALLARGQLSPSEAQQLDRAAAALHSAEEYVGTLHFATPLSADGHQRHLSTVHALDHLGRLIDVALDAPDLRGDQPDELRQLVASTREVLARCIEWSDDAGRVAPVDRLEHLHGTIVASRKGLRSDLLDRTAAGSISPTAAGAELDRLRWLEQLTYLSWRLTHRLRGETRLPGR